MRSVEHNKATKSLTQLSGKKKVRQWTIRNATTTFICIAITIHAALQKRQKHDNLQ